MPTISIVTICYNNLSELIRTIESIDTQIVKPYEHWIIDGSTNTEIRNFLQNLKSNDYRKWISEPDRGISDAFNKGIINSSGEVIGILNSGDLLFDGLVLQNVHMVFDKDDSIDWCHGMLKTMRGGQWVIVGKPFDKEKLYRGMRSVFHPTMYLKKSVYDKVGMYDLDIKIAMDFDMLCRISNYKSKFIYQPISIFDPNGISTNNYLKGVRESYKIYRKYFGFYLLQPLWYVRLYILYKLLNSPIGPVLYTIKKRLGFVVI